MAVVLFLTGWLAAACSESTETAAVHVITVDGSIDPVMERFIDRGIDRAEDNDAKLIVIEIDTPGGLSSSMREIVQRIERSDVPVAAYVSPSGARAASAGTFIVMSANIAAMAPNTSIGAASAINSDGSDIDGTLGRKVENDSVAFIRGIAELRGRNADWAEQAVRDAVAANQSEALDLDVVDLLANDRADLLRQLEGRTVELRPGTSVTLTGLADAPLVQTKMTAWEKFLSILADPTLASLLITIGFLGLIMEMASPGLIVPGTAGVIAIALGFLGFGVLPVDTVGLVLIAFALVLFGLELFLPSGGILGASGAVALILGGIVAFRDTPAEFRPPVWIMALLAFFIIGLFFTLTVSVARVKHVSAAMGTAALIGKVAVVRSPLAPEGYVFVQGERWRALVDRGSAKEGDRVRIIGAEGFRLRVRKEEKQ
ncbi:hypothetical protein AYO38_03360 [bacterium SCGC AG-212-C10]|nr:hypothetical protein AYO38_03360 [bacterium SCGC AG-212-C10]